MFVLFPKSESSPPDDPLHEDPSAQSPASRPTPCHRCPDHNRRIPEQQPERPQTAHPRTDCTAASLPKITASSRCPPAPDLLPPVSLCPTTRHRPSVAGSPCEVDRCSVLRANGEGRFSLLHRKAVTPDTAGSEPVPPASPCLRPDPGHISLDPSSTPDPSGGSSPTGTIESPAAVTPATTAKPPLMPTGTIVALHSSGQRLHSHRQRLPPPPVKQRPSSSPIGLIPSRTTVPQISPSPHLRRWTPSPPVLLCAPPCCSPPPVAGSGEDPRSVELAGAVRPDFGP